MCMSRLGVRSSWRFCLGTLQHWQRYPLSSTDTLDTNTLWELIINSVNRSHHNKDQKHLTLLSLLEPMPRVCRVISEDDSSANELFDQTGASRRELQQCHLRWRIISVHLPSKVHAELFHNVTHVDHALLACRGHFMVSGCFLLMVTYKWLFLLQLFYIWFQQWLASFLYNTNI